MSREPVAVERRKPFRARDIQAAYFDQGGLCALCPNSIGRIYVADHRVPRALGGKTCRANLQLLCEACNAAKTNGKRGDIANVAKAVRLDRASDPATRPKPKRPLKGRGFDRRFHNHMDGTKSER